MLNEVRQQVESTLAPLISGILGDTQKLLRQEFALAKAEIREDGRKAKNAAISMAAGAACAFVALVLACLTSVHLLAAVIEDLPLWGAYAIVTAITGAGAVAFLMSAKNKAKDINVVPDQTIETLKENVQWIHRKT